jgi:hypothetical protein
MFEALVEQFAPVGRREVVEVFEATPSRELVAAKDIVRRDQLGRAIVACPAGTVPAAWLQLTAAERSALVEPPPPVPDGTLIPGRYGFTPSGVVTGGWSFAEGA